MIKNFLKKIGWYHNQKETDNNDVHALGTDWFYDRYLSTQVEANRYLLLSIVLTTLLILSIITLFSLMPLKVKETQPFVLTIDNTTGVTTVLTPIKDLQRSTLKEVTKYFLSQYLQIRESYHFEQLNEHAAFISAFSTKEGYQHYIKKLDVNDLNSIVNRLGKQDVMDARILSVTFPYENMASIRFAIEKNGTIAGQHIWLATVKFQYADDIPLTMEQREINPIGLFVTDYQLTQEK